MCLPGAALRFLREIRTTIFFSGSINPILGRDDSGNWGSSTRRFEA